MLRPREFSLLQALIEEPTRVFTWAEPEDRLYDSGESIRRSTIEQHVNCLRRKIGADQIVTVRGVGYRLKKMRIGYLYNGIVRWGVDRLPA